MSKRLGSLVVAAGMILVACGVRGPINPEAGLEPALVPQPRERNYDQWFQKASSISSVEAARHEVDLPIVVPRGLGEPFCICLSSTGRAVAFIYDTPELGRVVIVEGPVDYPTPEIQREFYRHTVGLNGKPNIHGSAEMVTVKGNVIGLLITSEDGVQTGLEIVLWGTEGDVQTYIIGPELTREQALGIANEHL